jgi:hypothetical protein
VGFLILIEYRLQLNELFMIRIFWFCSLLGSLFFEINAQSHQEQLLIGQWKLEKIVIKYQDCPLEPLEVSNRCDSMQLSIDASMKNTLFDFSKKSLVIQNFSNKPSHQQASNNGGMKLIDSLSYTYKLTPSLLVGHYHLTIKRKKQRNTYFIDSIDEQHLHLSTLVFDANITLSVVYHFTRNNMENSPPADN